jgi:amidophosphoribosyltransferase
MSDFIGENCGVCLAHSLHDVHSMIKDLQHRGKDSCGIAAISDTRIDVIKWLGRVRDFDVTDLYEIFPVKHNYHTFIAHVRYSTSGSKDLKPAHPHFIGGKIYDQGDHIIIKDCDAVVVHNGQINPPFLDSVNKTKLLTSCDTEAVLHYYLQNGEKRILSEIPGSYTMIIADKKRKDVMVLRDRTGIKPGVIGKKDGKYLIASEDISFRKNGAQPIKDIDPGCVYYFHADGTYSKEKVTNHCIKTCFFEINYISDQDTIMDGKSVKGLRFALGEKVGQEFSALFPDKQVDYVTYLPRCPEPAAGGFSRATHIPFLNVFYKKKDDRAFMGPSPEERKLSITSNLHLIPGIEEQLTGKVIVVIDDSCVRGNNAKHARALLYNQAGVKEVIYVLYTPPIGIYGDDGVGRGCEYGVDMPPNDGFMTRVDNRNRTSQEIAEFIGMPVFYISQKGMAKVFSDFGINPDTLCTYCIGGEKPF